MSIDWDKRRASPVSAKVTDPTSVRLDVQMLPQPYDHIEMGHNPVSWPEGTFQHYLVVTYKHHMRMFQPHFRYEHESYLYVVTNTQHTSSVTGWVSKITLVRITT